MNGGVPDPVAARDWLQHVVASNRPVLEDFLAGEAELSEIHLQERFPSSVSLGGLPGMLLRQWADIDRSAFDFIRKKIAEMVRAAQPVPDSWRELHAKLVEGAAKAPKKRGRSAVNEKRDELLTIVVKTLERKFNLPRLANPTARLGDSAIEIAVGVLTAVSPGLAMVQPEAIDRAITRREKSRSEDPMIRILDA